jgi:hypothetical protein
MGGVARCPVWFVIRKLKSEVIVSFRSPGINPRIGWLELARLGFQATWDFLYGHILLGKKPSVDREKVGASFGKHRPYIQALAMPRPRSGDKKDKDP